MSSHGERTQVRQNGKKSRSIGRRTFLAATGTGAAATLAGCLGGDGDGDEPIRFGAVYLLSGLAEQLGAGSAAAGEVAVQEINDAGGINGREIEYEARDHGDDPQSQVQSLVQEFGADVLFGMTSSGVTLNTLPTWRQLGKPVFITDIGTPWITEHDKDTYGDYIDGDGTAGGIDQLFRANSHSGHMAYALAEFTNENYSEGIDIATMGPDYAYGHQTWDYFQAFLDGLGFEYNVVAEEFPELGASDMSAQITNVQAAEPDIVHTSFWASDTVTFTSQAAEQGLFDEVMDVYDTIGADPSNFESLGDDMPEGFHYSGWYWPGAYGTDADQAFIDLYVDAYEDDDSITNYPTFTGGSTYTAVHAAAKAIEESGGTDADGIIEASEGLEVENDPRGPAPFDPDSHQMQTTCVIGESSHSADVPYDGAGQTNTQLYELDRDTALDLLEGSELPPGI